MVKNRPPARKTMYEFICLLYKENVMGRMIGGLGVVAAAAGLWLAGTAPSAAGESFAVRLDKVEVLRLEQPASIVVVGNPEIADVTVENPRLLFVIGRAPGETNLMLFDPDGVEIANYELVVVGERQRHVTLNRNASVLTTFSCDPRCIEVPNPSSIERQRQLVGGQQGEEETGAAPPPPTPTEEVTPSEQQGGEEG
jgi:hypothetical protein